MNPKFGVIHLILLEATLLGFMSSPRKGRFEGGWRILADGAIAVKLDAWQALIAFSSGSGSADKPF